MSLANKHLVLITGPTCSGKSQLAILLKRGLEAFTKTAEGAIYALADSPMHEDPLCAIPHELRKKLKDEYGLKAARKLEKKIKAGNEKN